MVVMINDCAFVGETLLKYLPLDVKWRHIKRSRRLFDKTIGLAHKILKAKADVYHVHYLLQDCYFAARFNKRPLIGHAHGSDLRSSIRHPLWSRIVKYNLRECDKILVSTPDILVIAKQFREDAKYLPNPVDTNIFYPKLIIEHKGKKRVLIASDCNWAVKGTDMAIRALSKIKNNVEVNIIKYGVDFKRTLDLARSLGLQLNVLPKVPHEKIREYYWSADVIIDRFKIGSLGMISLEAIACGRPVVVSVASKYPEYKDFPLKDLETEEDISDAILNADMKLWRKEHAYLSGNHDPKIVIEKLLKVYNSVI